MPRPEPSRRTTRTWKPRSIGLTGPWVDRCLNLAVASRPGRRQSSFPLKRSKSTLDATAAQVAPLGHVLSFMRLLWAVTHGLESTSKRMLAELGVTGPQRLVLRIVGQNPQISPGDLARVMHVHPSSLTGVLQRLADAKLLRRERDPDDGRRATLALSPLGRQINARRAGTVEAAVQRALSTVPPEKLRVVEEALKKLARELETDAED